MPANPNGFNYFRRGESIRTLRGKTPSGEFNHYRLESPLDGASALYIQNIGGMLSLSGITIKSMYKSLVGTISFSGSITRTIYKVFDGIVSLSGNLVKSTSKRLSGIISFTGDTIVHKLVRELFPIINKAIISIVGKNSRSLTIHTKDTDTI